MEKSFTFISISILALLFAACTSRTDYNTLLVRADSLMQLHPDSALHLLEEIPVDQLCTEGDTAYYALLLTQARDKNYIVQTDDSLIRYAIAHYEQMQNMKMQARAYYYAGCVYRDSRKTEDAIKQFLVAESIAGKVKDYRLLSLIYNNMGYLYYAQDLNEQADSVYNLAGQIAVLLEDSLLQGEILSQRGMIRMEKGERFYPEAEAQMLKALELAERCESKPLKRNVLSSLSTLYNWMNDGTKAVDFAKRNLEQQADTSICYSAYQLLGSAYYQVLKYDSAVYYLQKALPTNNYAVKAGVYMDLADIAKAKGDFKTSLEMERFYSVYMDSLRMHRSRQANAVIRVEKDMQIASQQRKYNVFIGKYSFFLFLFIGIVAVCILFILKRTKTKTVRLVKEKERLSELQDIMQQQNAELKALHHERDILLKNTTKYSAVVDKMKRIVQDYKEFTASEEVMEKEDWLQLVAETDRRWNKIILKLQSKYNLSEEEIYLCCLYLTDMPVSHFGYLLNCTRDAIYKKANRIVEQKMGFSHKATSLQNILKKLY